MQLLEKELSDRILILDGAMGTMLQQYKFEEDDFHGERFKNHPCSLKGNNDLLSLTQPQAIQEIHRKFLEAGADIIETNTFSGTRIAMSDYQMEIGCANSTRKALNWLALLPMNLRRKIPKNHVL